MYARTSSYHRLACSYFRNFMQRTVCSCQVKGTYDKMPYTPLLRFLFNNNFSPQILLNSVFAIKWFISSIHLKSKRVCKLQIATPSGLAWFTIHTTKEERRQVSLTKVLAYFNLSWVSSRLHYVLSKLIKTAAQERQQSL